MGHMVYYCGEWGNYCSRELASLDDAINFAATLNNLPNERACFIYDYNKNNFWLKAEEATEKSGWVLANVESVRAYYKKKFDDKDPFGLKLLQMI